MEIWVKSKRMRAVVGAEAEGEESGEDALAGAANCHWRAAFRARSAKNWLAAGLASSAEETVPSGLSCTRTLMRTLPRMVLRAFSETSGRILRMTVGASGLAFVVGRAAPDAEAAGVGGAVDFAAGAGAGAFVFGVEAGEVALCELVLADELGGFALREFGAGELVALLDFAGGKSTVAGALETLAGFEDGGLLAAESAPEAMELGGVGGTDFCEREI